MCEKPPLTNFRNDKPPLVSMKRHFVRQRHLLTINNRNYRFGAKRPRYFAAPVAIHHGGGEGTHLWSVGSDVNNKAPLVRDWTAQHQRTPRHEFQQFILHDGHRLGQRATLNSGISEDLDRGESPDSGIIIRGFRISCFQTFLCVSNPF